MSVNPNHEDDFDGELPADFAALGEQLQADAQRLSSVFPACRPPTDLSGALAVRNRQWWMRREFMTLTAKAALVLLVAGLIVLASVPWSQPEVPRAPQPAAVANVAPATTTNEAEVAVQPVSYQPVAGFNGPELEGLLDLLQEQPQSAATSISF